MKFSLFTIAACVGPAFSAPTPTSPTREILPITFEEFLAQLPALFASVDKIEGSVENAAASHALRARSVDAANNNTVVDTAGSSADFDELWPEVLRNLPVILSGIIEALGPETNFDELWPEVLRNLPVILEALQDAVKDTTEAGARVRRATSVAGLDFAAILEKIPGILASLGGITTLPAPVPTAPVPGNGTQGAAPDTPTAPTTGGLDIPAILEALPAIITAFKDA
ncbi:hypothetical protein ACRE_068100 [Hapsidospora chrysogenum ATCC 11550]|uniref:Uncharacterized protein n=1 Tax=Hapsidospora chrysogenum (strain ATCC 11550 / CBS 779.69 / DSM 880 / IAM 14645 / JCM 23072 / IMI 49137) TaxID=857340 RepID=A0A086SZD1_HAPC1|nr:hypothetical protein ACRE_068100 [Hapsidospora chrysogenum ATCC 11550]